MSGPFSPHARRSSRSVGHRTVRGVAGIAEPAPARLQSFAGIAICLLGCMFAAGMPALQAQPMIAQEYEIKAVFLFNFAQFVEWPESAFPSADAPFQIGVLGVDPFGDALKQAVAGEAVRGRKAVLHHSHRLEDLRHCHLLFISASEKNRMREILAQIGDAPVLTVSDVPDFAQHGGIVNFFLQGNKVRFEINVAAAQHRGLTLSSQLLTLAKIVGPDPSKGIN